MRKIVTGKFYQSLDQPLNDGKTEMPLQIASDDEAPEQAALAEERMRLLKECIGELSPKEQIVARLYYGLDGGNEMTKAEMGRRVFELGLSTKGPLSRARIRQILDNAERKLREIMRRRHLDEVV